jgi:hypothetical protein
MGRLYVVDAYNLVLQTVDWTMSCTRAASRGATTVPDRGRTAGPPGRLPVRLIYEGAADRSSTSMASRTSFVEASFTSTGEKADERVVAVASRWRARAPRLRRERRRGEGCAGRYAARRSR